MLQVCLVPAECVILLSTLAHRRKGCFHSVSSHAFFTTKACRSLL